MSWLSELRLIPLFSVYLVVVFVLSTAVRLRQYGAVLSLVRRMPERWPNLLRLVRQHVHLFLTWGTVLPLLVLLGVLLANTLASQLLFPMAVEFRAGQLAELWPAVPVLAFCGLAMVGFDAVSVWWVGQLDEAETVKWFDQAEYWLRSWKAPVVRVFTLGYINPRQMVAAEVRGSLVGVSQMLNTALYWVSIQTALRIAFGLALWCTFALQGWLRSLGGGGGTPPP